MMMDVFSSFDPFIYSLPLFPKLIFWFISLTLPMIMISSFYLSPSLPFWSNSFIVDLMNTQTQRTTSKSIKGTLMFIPPLFFLIIMINLLGLMPYVFSTSSHLAITLSLGLPLWLSLIISSFSYNWYSASAMLLPGGAPDWLNPFLVLIETLSTLVRPLTLSFRLAANMTAGHVVLGLMGSYMTSSFMMQMMSTSSLLTLLVATGYIMFELGICMIQSYIFCLLITLYSDDHS